jgi:hypothetical protein
MSKKSPLALVNEKFGGKDKLVDKLVGIIETQDGGEDKEALKKRLLGVSNTKLLKLHDVSASVKDGYGSREKLVTAAATAQGRAKDKDYVAKLGTLTTKRLFDVTKTAEKRSKAAAR